MNKNFSRRSVLKLTALGAVSLSVNASILGNDVFAQGIQGAGGKKIITVFFSKTGTTENLARQINRYAGGDILKVNPVKPYPVSYNETTALAKKEQEQGARPQIEPLQKDLTSYDIILLGYPNWWGTIPMAYFTLLESVDLSGKIIAPFCTHEGSYMGRSEDDIKKLAPNAKVLKGYSLRGIISDEKAEKEIGKWFSSIGLS